MVENRLTLWRFKWGDMTWWNPSRLPFWARYQHNIKQRSHVGQYFGLQKSVDVESFNKLSFWVFFSFLHLNLLTQPVLTLYNLRMGNKGRNRPLIPTLLNNSEWERWLRQQPLLGPTILPKIWWGFSRDNEWRETSRVAARATLELPRWPLPRPAGFQRENYTKTSWAARFLD